MIKTLHRFAALMTSFSLLLAISVATSDCSALPVVFTGDCDPNIDPNPSSGLPLPRACNPFNINVNDQESNDFNETLNWWLSVVIGGIFPNDTETFQIQNTRTAVFSSDPNNGSTTLGGLVVSDASFGRLRMTGGSLTLLRYKFEVLEIGRERDEFPTQGDYNNNGFNDAADSTVWRDTLGQVPGNPGRGADGDENDFIDEGDYVFWADRFGLITRGGEVIMTGSSTLTSNGVALGRRTRGLLTVGPDAVLNVRGPFLGNSNNIRSIVLEIGIYGPPYITGELPGGTGGEVGFAADGLMIVEGTVNADALRINVFGAKGEVRLLPGGSVNLNGALILSDCDLEFFANCAMVPNPVSAAEMAGVPVMSSKLSITGSGGNFTVGEFDPNMSPPDSAFHETKLLRRRDIYSGFPATATISFTADPNGVTPIVLVDNRILFPGELTGSVFLDGQVGTDPNTYAAINLELDLDAYTGGSPLMLIDAPPGHLFGVFNPAVTFLGTTTADVIYDYANGDVFLENFVTPLGVGIGSLEGSTVPEPSGLVMTLTLGLLLCSRPVRERNGSWPGRHRSRGKSLT